MKVHYNFDDFGTIKNPVVTTGSFDGVHTGHRVIIQRINFLAKAIDGESVLITFYPHPRKILFPNETLGLFMINTPDEKEYLLSNTGLDHLFIINFTIEFSKTPSEVFVKDILLAKLGAKIIVVGFNHHFGHNRQGDYQYLYQLSKVANFRVEEIPQQDIENEAVSSTRIRKAILEGKIGRANAYLNHPFFFITQHLKARKAVFENFLQYTVTDLLPEKILPPSGRYAGKLLNVNGITYILCDIFANRLYFYLNGDFADSDMNKGIIELHMQIRTFTDEEDLNIYDSFMPDVVFLSELIY